MFKPAEKTLMGGYMLAKELGQDIQLVVAGRASASERAGRAISVASAESGTGRFTGTIDFVEAV